MHPDVKQAWECFLNPETLRPRLITASLYIAGFEFLKETTIIGRIRDFMCLRNEGGITPAYKTEVLARNKSPVYASLDWLKEMEAIQQADIEAFDRIKACRNRLAHELLSIVASEGLPTDLGNHYVEMIALLGKIERWWTMNVEIPCNPDYDGREVREEDVTPGSLLIMQLLVDIALGNEEDSRSY